VEQEVAEQPSQLLEEAVERNWPPEEKAHTDICLFTFWPPHRGQRTSSPGERIKVSNSSSQSWHLNS